MEWQYLVEELAADGTSESVQDKLTELGSGGWEAVTSWAVPGDPHVNNGAWRVYLLLKKPKGSR
jgi:hypothetical protein